MHLVVPITLNPAWKRRREMAGEGGFTFIELLVATAVMGIVATAIGTFIAVSARTYGSQEDRVTTTDDARNALLRIASDIRDAGTVTFTAASGVVTAEVRRNDGSVVPTTYSCSAGSCSAATATGSELLVEGVTNANVFTAIAGSDSAGATSRGGAIQIRLALDLDQATNPLVLNTAVKPRNCAAAGPGVVNPPC